MNLATLMGVCAAYHEKEVADLTKGTVNLFLVAANNSRKKAEKLHDFELAKCTAQLNIDGVNGGDLRTATLPDGFSSIKSVLDVSGLLWGGTFVPFDFTSAEISIERDRNELDTGMGIYDNRYPSDAQFEAGTGRATLVQRGNFLFRFPRANTVIDGEINPLVAYLECNGWLADYTQADVDDPDAAPKDFLLDVGFEYLQWCIIIELNKLFKTFVPRQEGNLSEPEDMRKQAWADLLLWDSYLIPPSATTPR
jgi:hypothetical protein